MHFLRKPKVLKWIAGNTVLTIKVICYSNVTSMDETLYREYKTLKRAASYKDEMKMYSAHNRNIMHPVSTGEPCMSPYLCDFLKTVYETNVVPNYTTNGIILSYWDKPESEYYDKANKILDTTKLCCGGVAVSYGNKALRRYADDAIEGLLAKGDCHVMIHHIISDNKSVDEFVDCWKKYGDKIRNHVLLPLMASGRSKKGIEDGTFEYLEDTVKKYNIKNVAFGAHFIKSLEKSNKIKTWLYPAESYSKNVLLKENEVVITSSSFNLTPVKTIKL